MDKNKKFFIIAGILLVFLVIFFGVNEYQKQQKELSKEELPARDFSKLVYFYDEGELANFMNNTFKVLLESQFNAVICELESKEVEPACYALESINGLLADQYTHIAVKVYNLIQERFPNYLEEKNFAICDVSSPSINEHLLDSQLMADTFGLGQHLYFPEGTISCNLIDELKPEAVSFFIGRVPNLEQLNQYTAKIYLVNSETADQVMKAKSFEEGVKFFNNQPLLWELNFPIDH
ncbi:MAG: hypothetical protein PHY96_02165 [Candidatus Pacebacteria bacterium]|nr:hypothetical protein [Candidatus Paceibacterota bacterium]MDD5545046.1 hypothetical protein [Candidatus Paceibacterota bacterium]